jgi:hypothetical protein
MYLNPILNFLPNGELNPQRCVPCLAFSVPGLFSSAPGLECPPLRSLHAIEGGSPVLTLMPDVDFACLSWNRGQAQTDRRPKHTVEAQEEVRPTIPCHSDSRAYSMRVSCAF